MGRPRHPPSHRSWPHRPRPPARAHFLPLLAVLALVVVVGGISVVMTMIAILAVILPLLLVGTATVALVAARRRMRRLRWSRQAPVATQAAAAPATTVPRTARGPAGPDWSATRDRFARLRAEYAQVECDPLAVLRRPALTDVTVGATARFVDAFAEAQALDTDVEPPAEHRARFAAAVDGAWRAWHAALDAAERIRLAGIPPEERATVERAIKLLTVARDSGHNAERAAAYSRARAELAKLDRTGTLRLPPAAAAALDAGARGELPPAPATA